jgi:dTDP-4-dehydrorhamnose reductase
MRSRFSKAVVIGSTGLLGQALNVAAVARGVRPVGIARRGADYNVDATDPVRLRQVLDHVRPTLIINAAAQVSLDACEKDRGSAYLINAGIVASLADYCQESAARLCLISTDHYFSGNGPALHDEKYPVLLLNEYARTKFAGESFALSNPNGLVVRTNIVGYRNWPNQPTFVEWAIGELTSQRPMTLFDDFYTSSIDVKSFSNALFDLLENDVSGLFNLAARTSCSKLGFVSLLAERFGLSTSNCRAGSVRSLAGIRRAESLGLDVSYAESVLGYKLPDTAAVINCLGREYEEMKNALG